MKRSLAAEHLTPQKIMEITGGRYIGAVTSRDVHVQGAARDNREVRPGNLFVCIKGAHADGHSFANSAYMSGAACCLAERDIEDAQGPYVLVGSTLEAIKKIGGYYRSLYDIPVIGVTGSIGKTTVKELIAATLGAKIKVHKTLENMNNELGVPLSLLAIDESHEAAVIEMGVSDFGEMSVLAEMVRPDILVMTKIGYSHLEQFVDLEGVLRAKSEVFSYMDPGGAAVLNGDDDLLRPFHPGMRKILFGLGGHNDYCAVNIHAKGMEAVFCDIVYNSGCVPVKIPAYGSHLALLASAAAAVGHTLGLSNEEIIRGLSSYTPVSGRARVINTGYITVIDDCYNANPNSVRAALESLSELSGRRVAILGDMFELGAISDEKHHEIGVLAAQSGIDSIICCGDKAKLIFDGYMSSGSDYAKFYPCKADLLPALRGFIHRGDVVLVKASHGMMFDELVESLIAISVE